MSSTDALRRLSALCGGGVNPNDQEVLDIDALMAALKVLDLRYALLLSCVLIKARAEIMAPLGQLPSQVVEFLDLVQSKGGRWDVDFNKGVALRILVSEAVLEIDQNNGPIFDIGTFALNLVALIAEGNGKDRGSLDEDSEALLEGLTNLGGWFGDARVEALVGAIGARPDYASVPLLDLPRRLMIEHLAADFLPLLEGPSDPSP